MWEEKYVFHGEEEVNGIDAYQDSLFNYRDITVLPESEVFNLK